MVRAAVKYGILWQPAGALHETVDYWKNELRALEPDAAYVNHPVHLTVFLFMADPARETELCAALKSLGEVEPAVPVTYHGWHIFRADAAAGGGDTLVVPVQRTPELLHLQTAVATAFAEWRCGEVPYPPIWSGVFAESLRQWGFPFVGAHWLPHVSVGAASKSGRAAIERAQMVPAPCGEGAVDTLTLCRIMGEEHEMLTKAPLADKVRGNSERCC